MATAVDAVTTLSPLKRALLALDEMKSRLDVAERSRNEPIAIVGISCRFPGGAEDPSRFWRLLHEGGDAVTEVPRHRWDGEAYFDSNPDVPGKAYGRWGAFLDNIDQFDPQFFGIAPREAAGIDPQQRLLLEGAWKALEDGGIAPDKLIGTKAGVFIGINSIDYAAIQLQANDLTRVDAYTLSGAAHSIAAGRIAYILGLEGPALAVDTACSSSLVAVHLACQSLRNQECRMAIAGGVHIVLSPLNSIVFSKLRMLAADGRCKTFDAAGDGFVEGEGCAVVVLKRLSDALQDNDRIAAVIRGSAVNQDGASSGLTAPNGPSQESVIRAALRQGGIAPSEVGFIEAHGTGTSLGDPIEVQALAAVLGEGRPADRPLLIGSVKTNIGHTQAAAGIAGLIKLVLALEREEIPPSLHFHDPNPFVAWSDLPVKVVTEPTPWHRGAMRRVGGVSSFGFSGTNVHVVVEEAPERKQEIRTPDRPLQVLTVSARSAVALRELAARWNEYLDSPPEGTLATDIAFTINAGRAHLPDRAAGTFESMDQLRGLLAAIAAGDVASRTLRTRVSSGDRPRIAFLFTGQGAQYVGMGRGLYETQPTFRRVLDQCADLLRSELDRPLLSVLYPEPGETSPLDQTAYAQPALFALEYALAELWKSWGIVPSAVLGHSLGEYVAACLAGVLGLDDAIKLVAARGRLMQALPSGGAMAAVFADEARVRTALNPYGSKLSVAAVNGPENVVISGSAAALTSVIAQLQAEGIEAEPLVVSHAFHSSLMDPIVEDFQRLVAAVELKAPRMTLVSNLTGQAVRAEVTDPAYWRRHLREPVLFARGVATLEEIGYSVFVEIGPKPTLSTLARRTLSAEALLVPSLRRAGDDWGQMLDSLVQLYGRGLEVDWTGFDRDYARRKVAMPTYPFDRQRYWLAEFPATNEGAAARRGTSTAHPLLGRRLASALTDVQFESELSTLSPGYLADHSKRGVPIFPATAYLEMGLSAAREALGGGRHVFEELVITDPLQLTTDFTTVQTIASPDGAGGVTFQLYSRVEADQQSGPWRLHGKGIVREAESGMPPTAATLDAVRARCTEAVSPEQYYEGLLANGHEYGPTFRGVAALWRGNLEALAVVELPEAIKDQADRYRIHPVLLDAAMQILAAGVPEGLLSGGKGETFLPVSLGRCTVHVDGASRAWSHVTLRDMDADGFIADVRLYDESGQVIAEVEDVYHRRTSANAGRSAAASLYELKWKLKARQSAGGTETTTPGTWLVFADRAGTGGHLASHLTRLGKRPILVSPGEAFHASTDAIAIDPTSIDQFTRTLDHARATGLPLEGVVHLWGLGDGRAPTESEPVGTRVKAGCESVLHLVQAIAGDDRGDRTRLCVVTSGAVAVDDAHRDLDVSQAPLWGLMRTVSAEHPEIRCTSVDLDPSRAGDEVLSLLADEMLSPDADEQIALRDGQRYVPRLNKNASPGLQSGDRSTMARPVALEISERGSLDRLELHPAARVAPGPGEVEIRVAAAGLNFRDVLNALGMYAGEPGSLGGECVGTVVGVGPGVDHLKVGDHVLGMALGSLRSYVTAPAATFVLKPPSLSIEEAATIPVTFLTAEWGLNRLARMKAGDRVLIHAAAGGVGLAAVRLAQRAGAEIFATAGSPEKHAFLKSLGVQQVMSSRSVDFAEQVMQLTGGEGVDIVLNSLAGDFIDKSVSVLRRGGRFVEIGRAGIWSADEMAATRPDVEYYPILLRHDDFDLIQPLLRDLIQAFDSGDLAPLPHKSFALGDAVDAFRYMAQARHIGKIVLTVDHEPPPAEGVAIDPDATYVITGGLGALGLRVARWMIDVGARHLVLVSRSLPSTAARETIMQLEETGAEVFIGSADVSLVSDVSTLFEAMAAQLPPVRGIVHAAGVLDDGVLLQQTWTRFESVLGPKVAGAWNLHRATESTALDFFVMFSSMVSLFGAPGQGSYAAANAFLDALAHHRRARDLPALTINWGPWSEGGMASTVSERDQARWREQGFGFIPPDEGIAVLARMLAATAPPQLAVLPIDWQVLFQRFPSGAEPPVFADLAASYARGPAPGRVPRRRLLTEVENVAPNKRRAVVLGFMREAAANVLGLGSAESIDTRQPLRELGLDSLMAVELRNAVAGALERALPATLLFKHPTLEALADFVMSEIAPASKVTSEAAEATDAVDTDLAEIDTLSNEEAKQLLADELASLSASAWMSEENRP